MYVVVRVLREKTEKQTHKHTPDTHDCGWLCASLYCLWLLLLYTTTDNIHILHTHTHRRASVSCARGIYNTQHIYKRLRHATAIRRNRIRDSQMCMDMCVRAVGHVCVQNTVFGSTERFFEETQSCVLTMNVSSIQVAAWPHRFYKKCSGYFYSGTGKLQNKNSYKKLFVSLWKFINFFD